ncbi:MAG: zf-HC2 domain-containing protein [Acidobacteria bacterium]|nr:zf-HC2 domain-containing protein [Acidobacteriota bacterium]
MHAVVIDNLEEYLAGALEPATLREIEAHLCACASCRGEVDGMRQVSSWMTALKVEDPVVPAPGFYARVMHEIGDRQPVPTFSSLFSLDLLFARRLVFTCLLTLAVLGSYLVARETGEPALMSPEVVMAQQENSPMDSAHAHEAMLATLTRYEP